jgi:predicted nucleic acid-binding protein
LDRVFLDANVLFSAAYQRVAGLHRLWKLSELLLLTSPYALEEARRNLGETEQRERLARLVKTVEITPEALGGSLPPGVELPEKDAPILLAAIESRATHLLTGDVRDFGGLFGKRLGGVLVLTPGEHLRRRA